MPIMNLAKLLMLKKVQKILKKEPFNDEKRIEMEGTHLLPNHNL